MSEYHGNKFRLASIYLWLSLRLSLLRLIKLSSGILIGLVVLALTLLFLQTLLGQGVIWLKTHNWVQLPMQYWFVYPWGSIAEDMSLYQIREYINPLANPFITLGVVNLNLDPQTLLPREGSYWPTYTLLSGFSQWLSHPKQWLGLHDVVQYLLKCPITLFLALVALLISRSSKNFFDKLQRQIFQLLVLREKHVNWLKELLQASKSTQ